MLTASSGSSVPRSDSTWSRVWPSKRSHSTAQRRGPAVSMASVLATWRWATCCAPRTASAKAVDAASVANWSASVTPTDTARPADTPASSSKPVR